jgi:hypothetical protein
MKELLPIPGTAQLKRRENSEVEGRILLKQKVEDSILLK